MGAQQGAGGGDGIRAIGVCRDHQKGYPQKERYYRYTHWVLGGLGAGCRGYVRVPVCTYCVAVLHVRTENLESFGVDPKPQW